MKNLDSRRVEKTLQEPRIMILNRLVLSGYKSGLLIGRKLRSEWI